MKLVQEPDNEAATYEDKESTMGRKTNDSEQQRSHTESNRVAVAPRDKVELQTKEPTPYLDADTQEAEANNEMQVDRTIEMPPSIQKQMTKQESRSRSINLLNDYMTQDLQVSESETENAQSPAKINERTEFQAQRDAKRETNPIMTTTFLEETNMPQGKPKLVQSPGKKSKSSIFVNTIGDPKMDEQVTTGVKSSTNLLLKYSTTNDRKFGISPVKRNGKI